MKYMKTKLGYMTVDDMITVTEIILSLDMVGAANGEALYKMNNKIVTATAAWTHIVEEHSMEVIPYSHGEEYDITDWATYDKENIA